MQRVEEHASTGTAATILFGLPGWLLDTVHVVSADPERRACPRGSFSTSTKQDPTLRPKSPAATVRRSPRHWSLRAPSRANSTSPLGLSGQSRAGRASVVVDGCASSSELRWGGWLPTMGRRDRVPPESSVGLSPETVANETHRSTRFNDHSLSLGTVRY